jgi:hypothetical protein
MALGLGLGLGLGAGGPATPTPSANTTLDTYGHLWPDSGDSTRAAVEAILAARKDNLRTAEEGA